MYSEVVLLDLETTGIDKNRDEIIEIGAAHLRDGEIVATFSQLAKPETMPPLAITRLTGIDGELLSSAPSLAETLTAFLAFLPPGIVCVAHQAAFDRSFLLRATHNKFKNIVIDSVGLARIFFPHYESHSLNYLCEQLHIKRDGAHRALADALALAELWKILTTRALATPLPVVSEINYLLAAHSSHPYSDYFLRLESLLAAQNLEQATPSLFSLYSEMNFVETAKGENADNKEHWTRLDAKKIQWVFGADGALAKTFAQFTPRSGQITMAGEVTTAFNEQRHLIVEAGTGTGKSLAYLIPAVIWARENGVPVVISTNTKNLQEQLFEKDIALVRQTLGIDFTAAMLKGRSNYLCLRKLENLLRNADAEIDAADRWALLPLLTWSVRTTTGDIEENIIYSRSDFARMWMKLRSHRDDCRGRKCLHYRRCFVRKNRVAALSAQIIVANHSLVFADLRNPKPSLPPYQQLIFDEAHNLEDAATSHLSIEISPQAVEVATGRLVYFGRKKNKSGLLINCAQRLANATGVNIELVEPTLRWQYEAVAQVEKIFAASEKFFAALEQVRESLPGAPLSLRFSAAIYHHEKWNIVVAAKAEFAEIIGAIRNAVKAVIENLRQFPENFSERDDFIADLTSANNQLEQFGNDLEFALAADNENYAYWLEKPNREAGSLKVIAAPIAVGDLLYASLHARKKSIIFCSATMTVNNRFNFLRSRLGLDKFSAERLTELSAGLAFDYARQCRIFTPVFLPEPGEKQRNYADELAALLVDIFRHTAGRALGLFTSYEMLTRVYQRLAQTLPNNEINLLAQGQSGSRKNIMSLFQRDIHSVLLGTHSFWEGIDVVGESLSCLIIARLPFAAPSEPLIEARCEQVEKNGGNAFAHYTLPNALIKFRQGFGRLIRHPNDRGVVIVADRRIISQRYGQQFQKAVPCPTQSFADRAQLLDEITAFLTLENPPADK